MRRNPQHSGTLGECFAHQSHVALREVTHPAVQQLGGARRGAAREIVRLQQHHRKPAQSRVQRHTQTGRSTADDGEVEDTVLGQDLYRGGAGHV